MACPKKYISNCSILSGRMLNSGRCKLIAAYLRGTRGASGGVLVVWSKIHLPYFVCFSDGMKQKAHFSNGLVNYSPFLFCI